MPITPPPPRLTRSIQSHLVTPTSTLPGARGPKEDPSAGSFDLILGGAAGQFQASLPSQAQVLTQTSQQTALSTDNDFYLQSALQLTNPYFPSERRKKGGKKIPKHHHHDGAEIQITLKALSCWSRGRELLLCSSALGLGFFAVFLAFTPKTWLQILFQITTDGAVGQRLSSHGQQVPSLRAVELGV